MKWKPAKLTTAEFITGLLVKFILGILYGYIYLHYYGGDDTWRFHHNSIDESRLLLNDTRAFFVNDITPAHAIREGNGWLDVVRLYLIDLQYAILVKPLAVLNLLTGGNYYFNTVFFNCAVFCGHYWLFKALTSIFPDRRNILYYAIFLFLPAVFWLSGLRIDGLLFVFVALFFYKLVTRSRFRIMILVISFAGIVICRAETAILISLATVAYLASKWTRPVKAYTIVYCAAACLFFASSWFSKNGGLPAAFAYRQSQFLQLEGTRFRLDPLDKNAISYMHVFPQALANTYIRPFIWEAKGLLQLMAAAEVILFWLIVMYIVVRRHENWTARLGHPAICFLLFMSFSVYVTVGFLVPFPGAIIRYKAIALLLQVAALCAMVKAPSNYNKLKY